ncbi:MAG: DUF4924 family protein [Bacteroidales bacterium]|nr:DUF4924 family protein [Bacteroidales bacterium]
MIISRQKKHENIVEYILYMWQIEDLIRAYNFDLVSIEKEIISQFDLDQNSIQEMVQWYDDLIQLMLSEKVEEIGHIQMLVSIVDDLSKLHLRLLESEHNKEYQKEFQELLPFLRDLFEKVNSKEKSTIEIFIETLYGILMLKLKNVKISEQTLEASLKISAFLSLLSKKYHLLENDKDFLI